ncbi:MAG: SDR family oxidoreductase [Lachnospiraceae bacterium]
MLKNKVAVVTGGTRGIGYAVVEKFLKNGAKVVLFGSRQETVEKALAALKEENPEWEVSGAWPKLTDAKAVADEMAKIKEKYGRIDLARELGPFHIRVNAVAPGITNRTDMVAALAQRNDDRAACGYRIPLRRIGEAEDIANAFLFLASEMASYVTGEVLSVDGAMRS